MTTTAMNGGGDADMLLSSSRPLVAPTTRIQHSPSQESAKPPASPADPSSQPQHYQHEVIVSEAVVGIKQAPQIHVSAPSQLQAPAVEPPVLNDSNPMPPPPGLDQLVKTLTDNATAIAHFVALVVAAMFVAHLFPDISTKWLLGGVSVVSVVLFRYLNL